MARKRWGDSAKTSHAPSMAWLPPSLGMGPQSWALSRESIDLKEQRPAPEPRWLHSAQKGGRRKRGREEGGGPTGLSANRSCRLRLISAALSSMRMAPGPRCARDAWSINELRVPRAEPVCPELAPSCTGCQPHPLSARLALSPLVSSQPQHPAWVLL